MKEKNNISSTDTKYLTLHTFYASMAYFRSLSNHNFHVIILRFKEPNLKMYQNKYKELEMNKCKDGRKTGG
jgi:hypothetical protein